MGPTDPPPSYSHVYDSERYAKESQIPFVSPINEHVLIPVQTRLTEVPPHYSSILLRVVQYS
jgi:hypothetical protein